MSRLENIMLKINIYVPYIILVLLVTCIISGLLFSIDIINGYQSYKAEITQEKIRNEYRGLVILFPVPWMILWLENIVLAMILGVYWFLYYRKPVEYFTGETKPIKLFLMRYILLFILVLPLTLAHLSLVIVGAVYNTLETTTVNPVYPNIYGRSVQAIIVLAVTDFLAYYIRILLGTIKRKRRITREEKQEEPLIPL